MAASERGEPTDLGRIHGPNLNLRLIRPDDAEYVVELRSDPRYNRYLSPVTHTVAAQRRWIEKYQVRERERSELYYVIERRDDGRRCGLVRLYDIIPGSFTWGSWIIDQNKPPKAALESALLSFGIGFEMLDLPVALVDVRLANAKAISFYRRLGMEELRQSPTDIFFQYSRKHYRDSAERLYAVVNTRI